MPTPREYADQADALKSKAKGLEVPVFNTLINVLREAATSKAAIARLKKLVGESTRTRATRKFTLAAEAIRAGKDFDAQTLEMR